jgi:NAD(P)-dependent dehydrogenase (short-subunit alcohol dehydrogenase family)
MLVEPYKLFYGDEIDKNIEALNQLCPMGKIGDAWDTAYSALFLASDEAKYITGTQMVVDGGMSHTTPLMKK